MDQLKNQQAAEPIDRLYMDLEDLLMQNIIRHCQNYDQPIATDEWLLKKLAEVGKLNQENIKIISRFAGLSQTAAERLLNDAAEEALDQVEPGLAYLTRRGLAGEAVKLTKSKRIQQTMSTLQGQAKDTMNLCNTTMLYKARDAFQKLVRDVASVSSEIVQKQEYLDKLNKHASAVVIGAESRQEAMRKCIREFSEKGIPAFVDKAGREWTPEAYVNMVMRNTARKVADEVQSARCLDYGVHLIEIDSHSGARPKCARDQGKIFDLNNGSGEVEDARGRKIRYEPWNSSSYGEPDGILGINCGHHKFPFVPGVNISRYFPTEDMDANDRLYKQTQVQRALERDVRKQKRECMLYSELGDEEAFKKAAVKLKEKEAKLKTYVGGNDQLHRRKDREQVVGFDRSISSKAVAANKHVKKQLAEKTRNDKIVSEIKTTGMKGKIELSPKTKIDVSGFSFDDAHINGERKHKVTQEEAERFIQEADVAITKWNGRFVNYYGPDGAVFVDTENNNIRTAFRKEEFDDHVRKMREVLEKNGKG